MARVMLWVSRMRPLILGTCLAASIFFAVLANMFVEASLNVPTNGALRPPRLPHDELPGLEPERLSRAFGTPLRPRSANAPTRPLPLKLVGTLDEHAAAMVEPTTGQCRTLRIGDLWNGVELMKVGHGHVTLRHDGRVEELGIGNTLAPTGLPIVLSSSGGALSMRRADLDRQLPELLPQLMSGGRVVPAFQNGAMAGFRLVAIRPGSLYEQLGLKSGDLLQAVNGQPLASPEVVMGLMARLRDQRTVTVAVDRGGAQLTWNLTLD